MVLSLENKHHSYLSLLTTLLRGGNWNELILCVSRHGNTCNCHDNWPDNYMHDGIIMRNLIIICALIIHVPLSKVQVPAHVIHVHVHVHVVKQQYKITRKCVVCTT